jgi:DNA-binding NarL/FixJ family response regulator
MIPAYHVADAQQVAVVVEDERLFRCVLEEILRERLDLQVHSAADGESALSLAREHHPDLMVLDLGIPARNGLAVAEILLRERPRLRIIAVSSRSDTYTMYWVNKFGLRGFVDKRAETPENLERAFRKVLAGETYYSEVVRARHDSLVRDDQAFSKILSEREQELLHYFGQGLTNEEVAAFAQIGEKTAQTHRYNIMRKLKLHSTPELLRYATRHGFDLYDPRDRSEDRPSAGG